MLFRTMSQPEYRHESDEASILVAIVGTVNSGSYITSAGGSLRFNLRFLYSFKWVCIIGLIMFLA